MPRTWHRLPSGEFKGKWNVQKFDDIIPKIFIDYHNKPKNFCHVSTLLPVCTYNVLNAISSEV